MWELDHKEVWVLKNWCFQTVMLQKTPQSPLNCKEFEPVNPKGNQSSIFIGRTDAKAEAPILGHLMWSQLIGKDPDAGKSWRQNRRVRQRMRWLDSITNSMDMSFCQLQKIVKDRGAWHTSAHEVAKSRTQFRDWTTTIGYKMGTLVNRLLTRSPR